MNMQTEILFNKKKLVLYVIGAFVFVCSGIFITVVSLFIKSNVFFQLFLFSLGIICTSFFGLIFITLFPKLFSSKAGLIISEQGICDYTSSFSGTFIAWKDVKKVGHSYSGTNTFLQITLKNSDKFISNQKGVLKRFLMKLNNKISGTPIHILISFLDIDVYSLKSIIATNRYSKFTSNS